MKKTPLFLVALGALSLAACSQDEPVSTRKSNEAISFRSGMATRATETNNSNLSAIYATALNETNDSVIFENVEFSKGSDSFFTSTKQYYWPENKDTVQFYSYAPSQDELGADIERESGSMQLVNYAVPDEIADQVDFITANATGTKNQNAVSGVELTFNHRLSQIELRAKSENPDYTFTVTGMRIGRAEYMGTYDFVKNEWTLDDWHDTQVLTSSCDPVTLTAEAQSIMGPSGNAMLIPQTLTPWDPTGDPDNVAREAYLSVLVRITDKATGSVIYPFSNDTKKDESGNLRKYAWASIPLSGTWEQGKKYIYTLDFTDGAGNVDPDDPTPGEPVLAPIKFKVNVMDWTDADTSIPMTPIYKQ